MDCHYLSQIRCLCLPPHLLPFPAAACPLLTLQLAPLPYQPVLANFVFIFVSVTSRFVKI
jgi:hypothetical protein